MFDPLLCEGDVGVAVEDLLLIALGDSVPDDDHVASGGVFEQGSDVLGEELHTLQYYSMIRGQTQALMRKDYLLTIRSRSVYVEVTLPVMVALFMSNKGS